MTPAEGYPDLRVADRYFTFHYADGKFGMPYANVLKGSVKIQPGGNDGLNTITLTLLVSEITVDDDDIRAEIHVA